MSERPSDTGFNPWKLSTIGILVVLTTALLTGIVVASYVGRAQDADDRERAHRVARPAAAPAPPQKLARASNQPTAADIEACNRYASETRSGTTDTLKDALIGGAGGAGLGAAGGAIAKGGKGAGKGAGIGALVGAAAGTLYGLNETNHNDSRATEAYRACMRERGYVD